MAKWIKRLHDKDRHRQATEKKNAEDKAQKADAKKKADDIVAPKNDK